MQTSEKGKVTFYLVCKIALLRVATRAGLYGDWKDSG